MPCGPRREGHGLEAVQRAARRVRAVRAVRDQDLARRAALTLVIRADHHQTRELTLRAGSGLNAHAIHAHDFGEQRLQANHQLERPPAPSAAA